MIINQIHGRLHGIDPHYLQHRAKDFGIVAIHLWRHTIDQCATHIEAIFIAINAGVATIHDNISALLFGTVDIAKHLLLMLLGNHWAKIIISIMAGANL